MRALLFTFWVVERAGAGGLIFDRAFDYENKTPNGQIGK